MRWIEDVGDELARLDASPRALRRFALTVGGVLVLISAWLFFRKHAATPGGVVALLGVLLVVTGLARPLALRGLHRAWMALALALGWLTSRLVVALLFYLALTPVALLARLTGTRFLETGRDPAAKTYWTKRARKPATYDKMF